MARTSATGTICGNDGDPDPNDKAAQQLTATTPEGLGNGALTFQYARPAALDYVAGVADPNGPATDPVAQYTTAVPARRRSVPTPALPGVATYVATSDPLARPETYVGLGSITVRMS